MIEVEEYEVKKAIRILENEKKQISVEAVEEIIRHDVSFTDNKTLINEAASRQQKIKGLSPRIRESLRGALGVLRPEVIREMVRQEEMNR